MWIECNDGLKAFQPTKWRGGTACAVVSEEGKVACANHSPDISETLILLVILIKLLQSCSEVCGQQAYACSSAKVLCYIHFLHFSGKVVTYWQIVCARIAFELLKLTKMRVIRGPRKDDRLEFLYSTCNARPRCVVVETSRTRWSFCKDQD
ncbi:hypothetical protein BKA93DRAFT_516925 [Sparassis latifolia]